MNSFVHRALLGPEFLKSMAGGVITISDNNSGRTSVGWITRAYREGNELIVIINEYISRRGNKTVWSFRENTAFKANLEDYHVQSGTTPKIQYCADPIGRLPNFIIYCAETMPRGLLKNSQTLTKLGMMVSRYNF